MMSPLQRLETPKDLGNNKIEKLLLVVFYYLKLRKHMCYIFSELVILRLDKQKG
jgi:hypothetical protein